MNPLVRLARFIRRPLRIQLSVPNDQAADALHGLAQLIRRRSDMTGRRIRIDLTIRPRPRNGGHR